jgi:hypothetical protein
MQKWAAFFFIGTLVLYKWQLCITLHGPDSRWLHYEYTKFQQHVQRGFGIGFLKWQLYLQLQINGVHAHPPNAELSCSYIQCFHHDLMSMLLVLLPEVTFSPKCCNTLGLLLNSNTPIGISNSEIIYSLLGWLKCYVCEHPLAYSSTCTKEWISDTYTLCSAYAYWKDTVYEHKLHTSWYMVKPWYSTIFNWCMWKSPIKKFLIIQYCDLLSPSIYCLFAVNKRIMVLGFDSTSWNFRSCEMHWWSCNGVKLLAVLHKQ